MKKPVVTLSLSMLLLASCGPAPVQTPPSASPTPTPSATPSPSFQGQTTLTGTVALDAQSVVVEASNAAGTFRKSANVDNNRRYTITGVPVGERIRLQAQYRNNPSVILSALIEPGADAREKSTSLDINLESTATDLIYGRAAAQGRSVIVNTSLAAFQANAQIQPLRARVQAVLQEIMATPIDAIVVVVPQAPKVVQTLDEVLPQIQAILSNTPVPSATPTPSGQPTPTPIPTVAPPTVFTPVRLVVKPGKDLTIARDTSLKLWVAGVDAFGKQQPLNVTWSGGDSSKGNLDNNGVFTPSASGDVTFTARFANLSETVTVHVTDADLRELDIVPDGDFSLSVGMPFDLTAKGVDEKGRDVIVTPTWSLSNTFVGSVDANGVFMPLQAGRVDVTARAREFTSTRTITVEAASSFLIEIAPNHPVVLPGKLQSLQVLGLDIASNTASSSFNFSVADSSIGNFVSQDISINGITPTALFQASKPGTTQVTVRDVVSNVTATFPISVAENVPYITGLTPANTPLIPGQTITVVGENFSANASENQVLFNNIPGTVVSSSPSSVLVTVPVGAFTGFLTVVNKGARGSSFPFVITPQIDNVIPREAGEGDLVTITGQHFSTDNPAHNAVFFDSERASIPVNVTNSSLQVRVPANLDSEVQVSVRVKGQLSNFQDFTIAGGSLPSWSEEEDSGNISRAGAKAEVIDGDIYVIGAYGSADSTELLRYDPGEDEWESLAELPDESSNLTTAMLDDQLYAIGGSGNARTIFRYDPDSDEWEDLSDTDDVEMDNAHIGAVAEAYQGKLYIIGGEGSDGRVVEECDPDGTSDPDDACEIKTNSPTRRFEAASALYNGKIYVIGGGEDGAEDRITAYDIEEDEWEAGLAPMPKALRRAGATVLNGKIYVIGGEDDQGNESDSVYEYSPGSNSWRTLKSLPSARSGPAVATISSRVYVIGGENSGGNEQSTVFKGQF